MDFYGDPLWAHYRDSVLRVMGQLIEEGRDLSPRDEVVARIWDVVYGGRR